LQCSGHRGIALTIANKGSNPHAQRTDDPLARIKLERLCIEYWRAAQRGGHEHRPVHLRDFESFDHWLCSSADDLNPKEGVMTTNLVSIRKSTAKLELADALDREIGMAWAIVAILEMICHHQDHQYAKSGFQLATAHAEQLTALAKSYEGLRSD
jgi:hypothetical protein